MGAPEDENIRLLLEEIRRTISDNSQFLQRLKHDDDAPDEVAENGLPADSPEDGFEEL